MSLELHPEAAKNLNSKAEDLNQRVIPDPHKTPGQSIGFTPDVVTHVIPEEDIHHLSTNSYVGGPLNREIAKTFSINGSVFGLFDEGYKALVRLAEAMQKTKALKNKVSVSFLIDAIFEWIATSHRRTDVVPMTDVVLAEAEKNVQEIELWLPVAMLYIESEIVIGQVVLKTITKEFLDNYHGATITQIRNEGHEISPELEQHFRVERQELQGLAAATITVNAEPLRANEIAFEEAENSLAMLRLYSLANLEPELTSNCTFLGRERIEEARTFTVRDRKIQGFSRTVSAADPSWKLDRAMIDQLQRVQGLGFLSNLLQRDNRTEYEQALLDCLLLYSNCALAKSPSNKLVAVLTALESMLLQNSSEPIQQNLAERIAYMFSPEKRIGIKKTVLRAYRLRSSFIHHGHQVTTDEIDALREFFLNAWSALHGLMNLSSLCNTRDQFFKRFEEAKMSGASMFEK